MLLTNMKKNWKSTKRIVANREQFNVQMVRRGLPAPGAAGPVMPTASATSTPSAPSAAASTAMATPMDSGPAGFEDAVTPPVSDVEVQLEPAAAQSTSLPGSM